MSLFDPAPVRKAVAKAARRRSQELQDNEAREDNSNDKFSIVLDGETATNRGIADELLIRRADELKR
jgi:hypothetical protein